MEMTDYSEKISKELECNQICMRMHLAWPSRNQIPLSKGGEGGCEKLV